ncbi:MAG: RNA-binding protein [bacterium]
MVKRIYVGNLPFTATEDEVRELFASFGAVQSVKLITDRETGRPRGFGFVEMDDESAQSAISALDNTDLGGRTLKVNEARERSGGGGRGGGGGGRGGGGGGRGGPRGPRGDDGDRRDW